MKLLKPLIIICIISVSVLSCKKNSTAYQPQVTNNPDNFSFYANNSTNLSSTYDYSWNNTGQTAKVMVSSTITSGTADVSIKDANGAEVYSNDIQTDGSFITNPGVSGTWKIHIVLSGANGNVTFLVKKN